MQDYRIHSRDARRQFSIRKNPPLSPPCRPRLKPLVFSPLFGGRFTLETFCGIPMHEELNQTKAQVTRQAYFCLYHIAFPSSSLCKAGSLQNRASNALLSNVHNTLEHNTKPTTKPILLLFSAVKVVQVASRARSTSLREEKSRVHKYSKYISMAFCFHFPCTQVDES